MGMIQFEILNFIVFFFYYLVHISLLSSVQVSKREGEGGYEMNKSGDCSNNFHPGAFVCTSVCLVNAHIFPFFIYIFLVSFKCNFVWFWSIFAAENHAQVI